MTRRDLLRALSVLVVERRAPTVSTLIGTGTAGYSDQQVNDPYGVVIGPDGALYFCDLGNQRIRRLDLKTRRTSTIAGSGRKGYAGDQGPRYRRRPEHAARDPVRSSRQSLHRGARQSRDQESRRQNRHHLDAGRHRHRRVLRRRRARLAGTTSPAPRDRARPRGTPAHLRRRQPSRPARRSRDRPHRNLRRHRRAFARPPTVRRSKARR